MNNFCVIYLFTVKSKRGMNNMDSAAKMQDQSVFFSSAWQTKFQPIWNNRQKYILYVKLLLFSILIFMVLDRRRKILNWIVAGILRI
jgi:hypothetical protein